MIDVDKLLQDGQINDYFYTQLKRKLPLLPPDLQETYLNEAITMSQIGVSSSEDQKNFFYIWLHVPDITKEVLSVTPSVDMISKIAAEVYDNRNKYPINNILNFFFAVAHAAEVFGINMSDQVRQKLRDYESSLSKAAYPQGFARPYYQQPYNVHKWMTAIKDIYRKAEKIGLSEAFDIVTKNWDKMERTDFQYYLRFYQSGNPKYKIAQRYWEPDEEDNKGYFVPMDSLKADIPTPIDFMSAKDDEDEQKEEKKSKEDENEAREKIETQRSKIISRLNSAEKLLSSLDGQFFAGNNQEEMLRLLQDLKRKVQISNKMSVRSTLFEDFIYRTANLLNSSGKKKPAVFFYKVAQDAIPNLEDPAAALLGDEDPAAATPPDEESSTTPPVGMDDTQAAIKEFFDRLQYGVPDVDLDDSDDSDDGMISKAQQAFTQQKLPAEQHVERKRFDAEDAIDDALKNVTVADVVKRLELLSGIFRNREAARQLAIVDMMMDHLGIGSLFPGLAEATRSNLESNQYCLTRIDDALSKLRGTQDIENAQKVIDLSEDDLNPDGEEVRQVLEQEKAKEEERKKLRREKEDAKLQKVNQPPEELQQPVQVEKGPQKAKPLR